MAGGGADGRARMVVGGAHIGEVNEVVLSFPNLFSVYKPLKYSSSLVKERRANRFDSLINEGDTQLIKPTKMKRVLALP